MTDEKTTAAVERLKDVVSHCGIKAFIDDMNTVLTTLETATARAERAEAALAEEHERVKKALNYLEADPIQNNKHRMGLFGKQDVDFAISWLKEEAK